MSIGQVIYSALFFTLIEIAFLFLYILSIPFLIAPRIGQVLISFLFKYLFKLIFFITRFKVELKNIEKLPKTDRLVLIASSPCLIISFILYAYLPKRFRFVVDDVYLKMPISGRVMKMIGCLGYNANRQAQFAWEINQTLNNNENLLIFPEKPLNKGERIGRFKEGAISIAKACQAPLVPIVLQECEQLWPIYLLSFVNVKSTIVIGETIKGEEIKDVKATTQYLENYFLKMLEGQV